MEENLPITEETKINPKIVLLVAVLVALAIAVANFLISTQPEENDRWVNPQELNSIPRDSNELVPLSDDPAQWPLKKVGSVITEKPYIIEIKDGVFNPKEITAGRGIKIQIGFTAVNADYDVSFSTPISAYFKVEKNKSVIIVIDTTSLNVGEYLFVCKDFCPKDKKMEGKLIIK